MVNFLTKGGFGPRGQIFTAAQITNTILTVLMPMIDFVRLQTLKTEKKGLHASESALCNEFLQIKDP